MDNLPSIPDFFRNKNIFITGGSGFIGKVLVEKLLRSCPDLKNIYLLMRHKKGKTPEERIKAITDLPLFDLLKTQDCQALQKLKVVTGDAAELNLGLSVEDRRLLIDEINIVIHGAASVRFDDPLTKAVLMNTRGTREVALLALEMKKLEVLVHISTTYCNSDRKIIEERLYPAHADWEKTIEIAENVDKHTLNVLTSKYIHPLPNTYTFAKSLAEHVVYDLLAGRIPTVVFRPSIVVNTATEPFPGWIDNFNGPLGLMTASGHGVIRTVYNDPDVIFNCVPVDIIGKAIIISVWKEATLTDRKRLEVSFYNGCDSDTNLILSGMIEMGRTLCHEIPMNYILWPPGGTVTKCFYYHWLRLIFYQLFPALLLDGVIKLAGHQPLLMKIQRRIYVATLALRYFMTNQWQFVNDKVVALEKTLLPCDFDEFSYGKESFDKFVYFRNAMWGVRRYLLKEPDERLVDAKRHDQRMLVISQIFNIVWYLALLWIIFFKFDLISMLDSKYQDFVAYLTEN